MRTVGWALLWRAVDICLVRGPIGVRKAEFAAGKGEGALSRAHCKCAWARYIALMSGVYQVLRATDSG